MQSHTKGSCKQEPYTSSDNQLLLPWQQAGVEHAGHLLLLSRFLEERLAADWAVLLIFPSLLLSCTPRLLARTPALRLWLEEVWPRESLLAAYGGDRPRLWLGEPEPVLAPALTTPTHKHHHTPIFRI